MAPEAIGLALSTEQHASAVFSQGTTLSGVIERPRNEYVSSLDTQAEVDNIVTSFMARHSGGVRNAFKVGLLQEGMTYKQMAMTNNDAQMVEARRMGVLDIARLFGIPPVMLGEAAADGRGVSLTASVDRGRDGITGARNKGSIGFASIRGGDIVGKHDVLFASNGEQLTLSHNATDRNIFARGALKAVLWGIDKQPGLSLIHI